MSVSMYQSAVLRLNKDKESVQKQIASEQEKVGKLRRDAAKGPARLLLDPGTLSGGFEELEGLTAVLVTHQHADHLDQARLRGLLDRNPGARVLCDEGSAEQLAAAGAAVEVVHDGEELDVGRGRGARQRARPRGHPPRHPGGPQRRLPGGRAAVPLRGDAFTPPGRPVEALAVPAGAPWLKVSEPIDYLRQVRPKVAVPVHELVLSQAGKAIHYRQLEQLGGATLRVLDDGAPVEL
jgi:hypothetical protein